jgi:hypothetical protein
MRSATRILVMIACLAVGLALGGAANAETKTLAELLYPGASFDAENGATYSNFDVKIKGKGLSKDPSEYYVVPTSDGFALTGEFSETKKGGKLKMKYTVSGPAGLEGASLFVGPGIGTEGKLKVKEKLHGSKKIDKLMASLKNGGTSDSAVFGARSYLNVNETIKIKGDYFRDGSDSSVDHSFSTVPEPTTALMLAAGLAGLAAAGGRRSR